MVINYLKGKEPLQGHSLLFTTKSPGVTGTHFINIGRMKGCIDLEATSGFKPTALDCKPSTLTTRPCFSSGSKGSRFKP